MPGKVLLTDDYLIRMIAAAIQTLAEIIGLKTAGQYQAAQALIDRTLESLLGMRADLILRLDDETLFKSLEVQGKPDAERLAIVGKLFREEGDILDAQGDYEGGFWSRLRALNFAVEAGLNGKSDDPGLKETIAYLVHALQDRTLPADTAYALFCFCEESGQYQEADNVLIAMEQSLEDKGATLDERASFYNRLLQKSDAELSKGRISRLQVVQALNTVLLHRRKGT